MVSRKKYHGKSFGLKFKNATKTQAVLIFLAGLALWSVVALGAAWVFMHLWAWYMPVFWADAPILGYWHSQVTMLLLGAFLRRGNSD